MAALLTTLLRGLLGIVATIVVVAATWSLYANRAPLISAGEFVIGVFSPRDESQPGNAQQPAAPADAPSAPAATTYGESGQTASPTSPDTATEPAR
jgi:hypothetical protein